MWGGHKPEAGEGPGLPGAHLVWSWAWPQGAHLPASGCQNASGTWIIHAIPQKNSRKNLAATRPSFHSSFVFLPHSYKMTVNTWQMWGKAVLYQCTHTKQKPAWCYCLASMRTTEGCTYIWKRELLFHSLTLSPLHLLLFRSHSPTIKPPLARSKPCSLQPGKIPIYFKKFSLDKNATHPI